jgi:hypothetical protein
MPRFAPVLGLPNVKEAIERDFKHVAEARVTVNEQDLR